MKTRWLDSFGFLALALCLLLLGVTSSQVSASPTSALAPIVTSVFPAQVYNWQPTTITITGSNFLATPMVRLGNVSLTDVTFVNSTAVTANVPAGMAGGSYTLSVTNPDSQIATLANAFTVLWSGDGLLGNWQLTNPMTTPRFSFAAAVSDNHLYALGGFRGENSPSLSTVEMAVIMPDGSLGPWQVTSPMNKRRERTAAAASNGFLYAIEGDDCRGQPYQGTVERAVINPDGSLSSWLIIGSTSVAKCAFAVVTYNDYLYLIGGRQSVTRLNDVERAAINSDGTLGPWQSTSAMNKSRESLAAVASGGYIYALGGFSSTGGYQNSVERVLINPDGSLGSWQYTTSMSVLRNELAAVASSGYVYAIGGQAGGGNNWSSAERAATNPDGSLGPWQVTSPMTTERWGLAAVLSGNTIYALGGVSSQVWDSVERSSINVLDVTPPTGGVSIMDSGCPTTSEGRPVLLFFNAQDDVSGVSGMLISNGSDFAGANWEAYSPNRAWTLASNNTVYVRFRDHYGNISQTYSASGPVSPAGSKVFLPIILNGTNPSGGRSVSYQAHVQNNDWISWVYDGQTGGLPGQGMRLEAVRILLLDALAGKGITYQAHVQNNDWMGWVCEGQTAGTTGQSLRMEAIRIKLREGPPGYRVGYQVYVQDTGWTPWVYDGEIAGTTGQSKRLEGIRIQILPP